MSTAMRFIGVEQRAKQARAALNRLRWEVDYAIEHHQAAEAASMDLAEAAGILANILAALGEALPEDKPASPIEQIFGAARERFIGHVRYFTEYHRTAR